MPQIFGEDQLGLMSVASLWAEAGFLEDIEAHEGALSNEGFEQGTVPTHIDKADFHPRGDVWGQHLRSDAKNHTWVVARVANPEVNPNAHQTSVGGQKPRYSVEIHSVPRNPQSARARGLVTPLWEGNDIRKFLGGDPRGSTGGSMMWPDIKKAMSTGPRR